VIGSRRDAMRGAAAEAAARGYRALVLDSPIVGEAREASRAHLAEIADLAARAGRPLCVVSSGETTVRVTGSGRGGRNQEFALAASGFLPPLGLAAAASVGTDGVDGPTDAAGAVIDHETLDRARLAGLSKPSDYLDDNNSHAFFDALGDLVHTGPTGTNVGDLQVFLLA
jgi:hydroxypyruvate reductase